ncbi:hypothetical protein GDO81_025655 [Engystomops pustulosus]|uniref:Uncharacterized protein n=1 Tax=Engystomops pustulosus TaxID=76066 RepID=A0AAV6YMA9_ENGPU|nr:hypothetical protein GDO81_025655 [Engystomops pustulosus]
MSESLHHISSPVFCASYKVLARLQRLNKIQVHLRWFLIKKEQKSVIGSVIQLGGSFLLSLFMGYTGGHHIILYSYCQGEV